MPNRSLKSREAAFWGKFCGAYWERKAFWVRRPSSPLLEVDSAYLFTLLVRYSDHCRKTRTLRGMKLYIDGDLQYLDQTLPFLPEAKDQSLVGYHKRMKRWFSDYCLVCDELSRVIWEKWETVGDFLKSLYAHVGIPNRYTEMGLYLGNYRKTPFGVHADGCGVVSVPVIGTKRFRLWKSDYVSKNPELDRMQNYQSHNKGSELLIVKPGEIAYWPSSYWHIAESDSTFKVTWSLGLWVDQRYSDFIRKHLHKKMAANNPSNDFRSIRSAVPSRRDGYIAKLPPVLNDSLAFLGKSRAKNQDDLMRVWLKRESNNGFRSTFLRRHKPQLKPTDWVRGRGLISWAKLSNAKLCLSVKGNLLEMKYSSNNVKFIQAINSHKKQSALKLTRKMPELFDVLQCLYRWDGVELV